MMYQAMKAESEQKGCWHRGVVGYGDAGAGGAAPNADAAIAPARVRHNDSEPPFRRVTHRPRHSRAVPVIVDPNARYVEAVRDNVTDRVGI